MTTPSTHRARLHLQAAGQLYPGAWKQFDTFRQERKAHGDWPDYVYCPMAGAYAIVSGAGRDRVSPRLIGDVARLSALAAWRPTQGIYRFDRDLYAALVGSPPTGKLPCELLRRLPAWCVYAETDPVQTEGVYGFFAHLECDHNTKREELRLLLDSDDALTPIPLHLGPWDLGTAIDNMHREAQRQAGMIGHPAPGPLLGLTERIAPIVSLLLYLCSDRADYQRPERPQPKRTKQGWRLFPADKPTISDVGIRIGAALRARPPAPEPSATEPPAEVSQSGRASPRPHVRAAHWHLFWTGPRDEERKPRVRWIPPVGVKLALGDDLPAVVRQVK